MKKNIKTINRANFVKWRYERFLKKKEILGGTEGPDFYMTDLDRDYGDGVMRDVVLCDACNENIAEPFFTMIEDQLVYHLACSKERGAPTNVIVFPGTGRLKGPT